MNIDELQAGRELDALVAEKVIGWTLVHYDEQWGDWAGQYPGFKPGGRYLSPGTLTGEGVWTEWPYCPIPHYSTKDAVALEVYDVLKDKWDIEMGHADVTRPIAGFSTGWYVLLVPRERDNIMIDDWPIAYSEKNLAIAICRAIIKAVTEQCYS